MTTSNVFSNLSAESDENLSSSSNQLNRLDEENKNGVIGHAFTIEHINRFLSLVGEDKIIQRFLEFDRCYILADKYLLSMVFVYFVRADLPFSSYNRTHFFAALYLAHDMEEDDEDLKSSFSRWAFGCNHTDKRLLPQLRCKLWAAMDFRAIVSLKCCHQVMEIMKDCVLWTRERSEVHGGAIRPYAPKPQCSRCHLPQIPFHDTDCESDCSEAWDSDDGICFQTNKKVKLTEE